jgi:hypothetical protein
MRYPVLYAIRTAAHPVTAVSGFCGAKKKALTEQGFWVIT